MQFVTSPSLFDALIWFWGGLIVLAALLAAKLLASRSNRLPAARPQRPNRPWRRHYLVAAVLFTVLAVYGSLVPLQYQPLDFHEALARFRQIPIFHLVPGRRADWAANVLLFIPIGFCWMGTLLLDRRSRLLAAVALPAVVTFSAAASATIEFTQQWFPPRVLSPNDIVAESLGGLGGALLWLAMGQTLTDWIREYTGAIRPKRQFDWLLEAYCLGFIIYSVLPLDLTISVGELTRKFREGRITLVPFTDLRISLWEVYVLTRDVALFVPIGMLLATWHGSTSRPVRPLWLTAVLGLLFAGALETAQVLVLSRFASTTDVIIGTAGCILGGWLIGRFLRNPGASHAMTVDVKPWRRAALWIAAVGVYSLALFCLFCAPFDVTRDPATIRERYQGFFTVPFSRLYSGSELNAVSHVLTRVFLFAPIGAAFVLAVYRLPVPPKIRIFFLGVLVLIGAGISVAIEMAQVFLVSHYPDVTDVILSTAGVIVGAVLMWRGRGEG